MIIDFHTHVFPEAIADKTIAYMENLQEDVQSHIRGTIDALRASMEEAGVDVSVVLPVATKPKQFQSINAFAKEISKLPGIISFGGIHPASENWKEEIDELVKEGFVGIKLHPDYQKEFVDGEKTIQLTKYAINQGLHVVFHAGVDVGYPEPVHGSPKAFRTMLDALDLDGEGARGGKGKIILAHTGGYMLWDDVEKYLVGQNVYFDLAYSLGKIEDEQLVRIIRNHGVDRILFATDSPWDGQKEDVSYLKAMKTLKDEEKEMIFEKNACMLLKERIQ